VVECIGVDVCVSLGGIGGESLIWIPWVCMESIWRFGIAWGLSD
jgi:hypothetical protein